MTDIILCELNKKIRFFLSAFIIVLSMGVGVGIVYIFSTTGFNPAGTEEHFAGSDAGEFEILEKYPKSFEGMLLTTHTHLVSFSIIFLILGVMFQFNSVITGVWKNVLIIEPLIATITTFGALWGLRYFHPVFSYVVILSGILMYLSFILMVSVLLYDLLIKKSV